MKRERPAATVKRETSGDREIYQEINREESRWRRGMPWWCRRRSRPFLVERRRRRTQYCGFWWGFLVVSRRFRLGFGGGSGGVEVVDLFSPESRSFLKFWILFLLEISEFEWRVPEIVWNFLMEVVWDFLGFFLVGFGCIYYLCSVRRKFVV